MTEVSGTSQTEYNKIGAYKSCLSWFSHILEQSTTYPSCPQFFSSNHHAIAKQTKAKHQKAHHMCYLISNQLTA